MKVNLTLLRNEEEQTTIATWRRFGEERGTTVARGPTTENKKDNARTLRTTLDFLCSFFPQHTEFYSQPLGRPGEDYIRERLESHDTEICPVTQANKFTAGTRSARNHRRYLEHYEDGLPLIVGWYTQLLEPEMDGAFAYDEIILESPLSAWRPITLAGLPRERFIPHRDVAEEIVRRAGNKLGKLVENWGVNLPPTTLYTFDEDLDAHTRIAYDRTKTAYMPGLWRAAPLSPHEFKAFELSAFGSLDRRYRKIEISPAAEE